MREASLHQAPSQSGALRCRRDHELRDFHDAFLMRHDGARADDVGAAASHVDLATGRDDLANRIHELHLVGGFVDSEAKALAIGPP
jgi:hypothetical protein